LLVALALFALIVLLAFDLVLRARLDEDLAGARLTLFFIILFLHADEPIAGPNINGPGASKFHGAQGSLQLKVFGISSDPGVDVAAGGVKETAETLLVGAVLAVLGREPQRRA
jgi:hypothetical protein